MAKSNNRIRIARAAIISLSSLAVSFYHGSYSYSNRAITKQEHDVITPTTPSTLALPPLTELVQSDAAADTSCPTGTLPILDTIVYNDSDYDRRIPRILHFTSKSRCATFEVIDNIHRWRSSLPRHSIYLHDDEAVDRLTSHPVTQSLFPLLNETLKCVTGGATKSDLWRYLLLYLYGGIYSDIDNGPSDSFDERTVQNDDDFFSILEGLGIMAQYFMASSIRHPLMKESLDAGIQRLRSTRNVMNNNPALTTGPGAFKTGFVRFTNNTSDGYVNAGVYKGIEGRTVTVVGNKNNPKQYVSRDGLGRPAKKKYYRAIGAKHFFEAYDLPEQGKVSCEDHLRRSKGTNRIANYTHDGVRYVES